MSQALRKILTDISKLEGVRGVIVVSKDGMVLDAVMPGKEADPEDLGASVGQIVVLIDKVGKEFELGDPTIMSLEYENGMLVAGNLGDAFVLVFTDKNAMIGMVRNIIKKQSEKIKALI